MSGNPVRIGDGCATVTGYKLPEPLVHHSEPGRREQGYAPSQDTGLIALVWWDLFPTASPSKRRMRPARCACAQMGFAECLHSPFCRGLKVFLFVAAEVTRRIT